MTPQSREHLEQGPGWDGQPVRTAKSHAGVWFRRATLFGLAASLAVHLIAWAIAALVTVDYQFGDAGGSRGTVVDFAVMTEAELSALTESSLQIETPEMPELASPDVSQLDLLSEAVGGEMDALSVDLVDVQLDVGGGDVSGGPGLSDGSAGSGGAGSGDGASFFGLEAQGRRFAYIVDISSSMNSDTPGGLTRMELTKRELTRSVNALLESAQYLIVLYSDGAAPLGGHRSWSDAIERNRRRTRREIATISPRGGTYPLDAFAFCLDVKPKPDAIYFMTDGRFNENVPREVAAMNRRHRVPIHCIMFGEFRTASDRDAVEQMMRTIASDSGGSFARVEGLPP